MSKTTCSECCERIVVDIVNGYGYCMYCGAKVDTSDSMPLTSAFRNALKVELENNEDEKPLYREIVATFKTITGGDIQEGIRALDGIMAGGASSEEVMNIVDSQVIEWIVNSIDDDTPYRGGVMQVIEWINRYEEVSVKNYLWMVLMQLSIKSQAIINKVEARMFLISLFHFVRDYIPQFRNIIELINVCDRIDSILECMDKVLGSDEDDSDLGKASHRCSELLHHLCFMALISGDEMSQKEIVKANRALASKDPTVAMALLSKAFDTAEAGGDFFEPLLGYFQEMMIIPHARPNKGKPVRKGRN